MELFAFWQIVRVICYSKKKICLLKIMIKPRSLKAILFPGIKEQWLHVRLLPCVLSQASCFPSHYIWSNCLQITKKSCAQMLKQDVFFTFKRQADCQFLQLVILCKGRKRSLIITISCVWTLLCDGLSTWELTRMNSGPRDWRKALGKAALCKGEKARKAGQRSSPEIDIETSRKKAPVNNAISLWHCLAGRISQRETKAQHTKSTPVNGPLTTLKRLAGGGGGITAGQEAGSGKTPVHAPNPLDCRSSKLGYLLFRETVQVSIEL